MTPIAVNSLRRMKIKQSSTHDAYYVFDAEDRYLTRFATLDKAKDYAWVIIGDVLSKNAGWLITRARVASAPAGYEWGLYRLDATGKPEYVRTLTTEDQVQRAKIASGLR